MIILEGIEEHRFIDFLMERLQEAPPENKPFDAKFRLLVQSVEYQLEKEEGEFFPEQEDSPKKFRFPGVEMGTCVKGGLGSVTGIARETIKALPGAAALLLSLQGWISICQVAPMYQNYSVTPQFARGKRLFVNLNMYPLNIPIPFSALNID